jgi:uncharacterized protein YeaO (DUF488 family)
MDAGIQTIPSRDMAMIKVKHFCDAVEHDDGQRIWVEPINCCKDLRELCAIDHVLTHLGPPIELWEWFDQHGDGYDFFRGQYHERLAKSEFRPALQRLAAAARSENFTLVHQGDDPVHNSGTALYEFLVELQAYCPPE